MNHLKSYLREHPLTHDEYFTVKYYLRSGKNLGDALTIIAINRKKKMDDLLDEYRSNLNS